MCSLVSSSPAWWIRLIRSPRSYGHQRPHLDRSGRGSRDSITARSRSMPCPVRAETTTASGYVVRRVASASADGPVGLVDHEQLGHVARADVGQHRADGADLAGRVGIGAVDHVHQQVGRAPTPPGSRRTPRPGRAADAGRSRRCRSGCRPGRRRSGTAGWSDPGWRTARPRPAPRPRSAG